MHSQSKNLLKLEILQADIIVFTFLSFMKTKIYCLFNQMTTDLNQSASYIQLLLQKNEEEIVIIKTIALPGFQMF